MSRYSHAPNLPEHKPTTGGSLPPQYESERDYYSEHKRADTAGDTTPSQAPSRSIAVDSILNPPAHLTLQSPSLLRSRGLLESPTSSKSSSSSPSPGASLSRTDPVHYRLDNRSNSSRSQQRRTATPQSPASRTTGSRCTPIPGTMDVAQHPFLSSPRDTTICPSTFNHYHQPHMPERSQEMTPTTSHSSYSSFQQSPGHFLPQSLPLSQPNIPPFVGHRMSMDAPAFIPVTIDMDSGSKRASDKRRKNSHASRRFRQRKKASETEKAQIMERLQDENKYLKQAVSFYKKERDFFRGYTNKIPGAHIPPRPASPQFTEPSPQPPPPSESGSDIQTTEQGVRPQSGPVEIPYPNNIQPVDLPPSGYSQTRWPGAMTSGPSPPTPEASRPYQSSHEAQYHGA